MHNKASLREKVDVKQLLAGIESERKAIKEITQPKSDNKSKEESKDKTDYLQWLYASIFGLIVALVLFFLISKFYYGLDNQQIAGIFKGEVKPFFEVQKELTDKNSE